METPGSPPWFLHPLICFCVQLVKEKFVGVDSATLLVRTDYIEVEL